MSEPDPEPQIAFLDESIQRGRFYTISAAIINARDQTRIGRAMKDAGLERFHAHSASEGQRRAMENLLVSNRVRTVVSVCAPMEGSPEATRQRCLATMALTLRDQYGVTQLVMDSREDRTVPPARRRSRPNDTDLDTIDRLNLGQHTRIELNFDDDKKRPALSLADAAAWRTRRSLANDSITQGVDEFARLAPVTQLIDAASPPGSQPTVLQEHLNAFRDTSRERTAAQYMTPEREAAFQRYSESRRQEAAHSVHHGGPDWSFYFASPGKRQPPAPQAASAWDVFAGKGTTPTIRPRTDEPDQTRRQQPADPARRSAPGQRPAADQQQIRDEQHRRRPGPGVEEKTQRRPRPPQQTPRQQPRQQRRPDPPDKPRGLSR